MHTYIVDQAGRGRSGFDESVIHEAAAVIRGGDAQKGLSEVPSFGRITDNGATRSSRVVVDKLTQPSGVALRNGSLYVLAIEMSSIVSPSSMNSQS
mgnify:CR=1 FL=1